ncbi:MAG: hypothetical protein KBT02_12105 [Treponema sp.]|nr:hypothetical protein [Candidatus Treponema caballi]
MDVLAFLTLDIQRPNISAIVYGMQGDRQSRTIHAQLVDGSTQWTPPAGTFFVISYAKPDGTHGIYSQTETGNAAVTVSGSVATIALAEQVLTAAGDVPMTLTMFNTDGERLSAFTWLLIVKPAAFSDAAFRSTDYYNLLTEQITAILKAQESITGLTATATTLAPGSAATVTVTGGTGADDPFNFSLGIPRGNTGARGETGAPAEITAQIVEYQPGTSGTTAPTGAWSTTVPAVPAGQYLWTRTTITFNSGSPVVSYSVSRMGVDGTGSVKTVNNQSPDGTGNVTVTASDIQMSDNRSVEEAVVSKADITAVSNPNLLDNWWFATGVINQRGVTNFALDQYGVDRWKLTNGTATVTANGIVLNGTIEQILWTAAGTNVTASTLMHSGTATAIYNNLTKTFSVTSNGGTVRAVKLELGTVSTLSNDNLPDIALELLKCQQYQYLVPNGTSTAPFAIGYATSAQSVRMFLSLPTPLRSRTPSLEFLVGSISQMTLISKSGNIVPTAYSVQATANAIVLIFTVDGATVNETYFLSQPLSSLKIMLNANL